MVGGLHGKEGKTTEPILKKLIEDKKPAYGNLIVIPALCKNRKYVSTLNKEYYEGREGKKLLSLIQKYKPEIYVELHCYRKSAYKLLTDPKRKTKKGVPPFVEISNGVLMGSVSPHLLSMFRFRLAVVFEVPCKNLGLASKTVLNLLEDVKNGRDTEDILGCWKIKYPYQIRKAESLLYRWLGGEFVD